MKQVIIIVHFIIYTKQTHSNNNETATKAVACFSLKVLNIQSIFSVFRGSTGSPIPSTYLFYQHIETHLQFVLLFTITMGKRHNIYLNETKNANELRHTHTRQLNYSTAFT